MHQEYGLSWSYQKIRGFGAVSTEDTVRFFAIFFCPSKMKSSLFGNVLRWGLLRPLHAQPCNPETTVKISYRVSPVTFSSPFTLDSTWVLTMSWISSCGVGPGLCNDTDASTDGPCVGCTVNYAQDAEEVSVADSPGPPFAFICWTPSYMVNKKTV